MVFQLKAQITVCCVIVCQAQALKELPAELQGGGGDNNILAVALEPMRAVLNPLRSESN